MAPPPSQCFLGQLEMNEPPSSKGRHATLNLSIGPSCFVKCVGCYNHFGATASKGRLVSRREVSRLVTIAERFGYRQVTVAGGDPLTHPEILDILRDLKSAGMFVKLDTVGTALLRPSVEAFYGSPTVEHFVEAWTLFDLVDVLGVPLDGSTEETQRLFRAAPDVGRVIGIEEDLFGDPIVQLKTARHSVVADTIAILDLAASEGVEVCVNTVVHAGNVFDVPVMARLLLDHRPNAWQLFEFQATGRLASRNAKRFSLEVLNETVDLESRAPVDHLVRVPSQKFAAAARAARAVIANAFPVTWKSASTREGGYLMVNDAGDLWIPGTREQPLPHVMGNIRDSTPKLEGYLSEFAERASAG